jgi:hypothetical protein
MNSASIALVHYGLVHNARRFFDGPRTFESTSSKITPDHLRLHRLMNSLLHEPELRFNRLENRHVPFVRQPRRIRSEDSPLMLVNICKKFRSLPFPYGRTTRRAKAWRTLRFEQSKVVHPTKMDTPQILKTLRVSVRSCRLKREMPY